MGYKANYDLTRVRALPLDILRGMFPRACLLVTGREFVRTGGYIRVDDDSAPDGSRLVPNGRRVDVSGRRFIDYTTALQYARRVFGSSEHYSIRVLIPEIDCPGER